MQKSPLGNLLLQYKSKSIKRKFDYKIEGETLSLNFICLFCYCLPTHFSAIAASFPFSQRFTADAETDSSFRVYFLV